MHKTGAPLRLNVQRAFTSGAPAPFAPTRLFPQVPDLQDVLLATGTPWLIRVVALLWLAPVLGLLLVLAGWAGFRAVYSVAHSCVGRAWRTCGIRFHDVTGTTVTQTLHVFTLTALAVAQPLFDVVSREPAFFVARNTTAANLVALVGVVCVALPTVLVAIEIALARFSAPAARAAHGVVLTGLGAVWLLPLLKRTEALGAAPLIAVALTVAGGAALAYRRFDGVRTFVTLLSPAVVVVPALFLVNADVRGAVVPPEALVSPVRAADTPPIIIVVFDEFPVSSLLNDNHEIDNDRYPNFARLAATATWYRNAALVHESKFARPDRSTPTGSFFQPRLPRRPCFPAAHSPSPTLERPVLSTMRCRRSSVGTPRRVRSRCWLRRESVG